MSAPVRHQRLRLDIENPIGNAMTERYPSPAVCSNEEYPLPRDSIGMLLATTFHRLDDTSHLLSSNLLLVHFKSVSVGHLELIYITR